MRRCNPEVGIPSLFFLSFFISYSDTRIRLREMNTLLNPSLCQSLSIYLSIYLFSTSFCSLSLPPSLSLSRSLSLSLPVFSSLSFPFVHFSKHWTFFSLWLTYPHIISAVRSNRCLPYSLISTARSILVRMIAIKWWPGKGTLHTSGQQGSKDERWR